MSPPIDKDTQKTHDSPPFDDGTPEPLTSPDRIQLRDIKKESLPMQIFCHLNAFICVFMAFYVAPTYLAPFIWPRDITNPKLFTYLGIFINQYIAFFINTTVYYFIYKAKSPFFEKYKIEKEEWPWEKPNWKVFLNKHIKNILFNQIFIFGGVLLLSGLLKEKIPHRIDYESLPSWKEFTLHYLFTVTINDLCFFLTHWLLHHEKFYQKIHKVHHENKITHAVAAYYAHPIEFLFGNVLVFTVGNIILGQRLHLFTSMMSMQIGIERTMETHSGYSFTWSPIYITSYYLEFLSKPDFHSYHHLQFKGNYAGVYLIWDRYFGKTMNPKYIDTGKNKKLYEWWWVLALILLFVTLV